MKTLIPRNDRRRLRRLLARGRLAASRLPATAEGRKLWQQALRQADDLERLLEDSKVRPSKQPKGMPSAVPSATKTPTEETLK